MRHTILFLLLLGVVPACGGSTDDPTSSSAAAPIARADFTRLVTEAYCTPMATCCAQAGFPHNRAFCDALMAQAYPAAAVENEAEVDYDPVAARACVDGLSQAMAACVVPDGLPSCDRVFTGKALDGGSCHAAFSCAPGAGRAWCRAEGGGKDAKCVAIQRGARDSPCTGTCKSTGVGDEVACLSFPGVGPAGLTDCYQSDGLRCDEASRRCVPVAELGGACTEGADCALGTECVAGSCSAPPKLGGSCKGGAACAEGTCNTVTQVCTAKRPDGAACASSSECASGGCNESPTKTAVCGPRHAAAAVVCGGL